MRVHTAQAPEAARSHSDALEVWQLDAPVVSDHDVLDMALSIYQGPNLPAGLVRKLGYLPGKLGCQNLVGRDTSRVEFLYAAQLIRL